MRRVLWCALLVPVLVAGCAPKSTTIRNKMIRSESHSAQNPTGKYKQQWKWVYKNGAFHLQGKRVPVCAHVQGDNVTYQQQIIRKIDTGHYVSLALWTGIFAIAGIVVAVYPYEGKTLKKQDELRAVGLGVGLSIMGAWVAFGGAVAIGTAIRARDSVGKTFTRFEETSSKNGACEFQRPTPIAGQKVAISIGTLGETATTDASGKATLFLPAAKDLGTATMLEAKQATLKMGDKTVNVDLSQKAAYKQAVRLVLEKKRREAARLAAEEKRRREEAKRKYLQQLSVFRVRLLKKPRTLYAKGGEAICPLPKGPCSGEYTIAGATFKVVARSGGYWGYVGDGAQGAPKKEDIKGWIPRKELLSKGGYERHKKREERRLAAARRRQQALAKRVGRKLAGFSLLMTRGQVLREARRGWTITTRVRGKCNGGRWVLYSYLGRVALLFHRGRVYAILYTSRHPTYIRGHSHLYRWMTQIRTKDPNAGYKIINLRGSSIFLGISFKDKKTRSGINGEGRRLGYAFIVNLNRWFVSDRRYSRMSKKCN